MRTTVVLERRSNNYMPLFVCEVCGQPVEITEGNVVWWMLPTGDTTEPGMVHRGYCHRRFESEGKLDGGVRQWMLGKEWHDFLVMESADGPTI